MYYKPLKWQKGDCSFMMCDCWSLLCFCLCSRVLGVGWRAAIRPADHPVAHFDFDVVVGADGRRNTLEGETNRLAPPGWYFFPSKATVCLIKETDLWPVHVVAYHLSQYKIFLQLLDLSTRRGAPCHSLSALGRSARELQLVAAVACPATHCKNTPV